MWAPNYKLWQTICTTLCRNAVEYCFIVEVYQMAVSYKKLWKLLIDRDIKKGELSKMAGISAASITKMGNGGNVTADILAKICVSLGCNMDDILEIVPDEDNADE